MTIAVRTHASMAVMTNEVEALILTIGDDPASLTNIYDRTTPGQMTTRDMIMRGKETGSRPIAIRNTTRAIISRANISDLRFLNDNFIDLRIVIRL